ncbi:hypothetical protein HPB47_013503 [Ixodes persulcatus]|uniref:Uncharacterized protein n=1 Tax=Ixodes persulcatus TaxID=34615 RepID=A0AC60QYK5_IXOPE|nr:hypothetical protein HPB47_013503 [Ixodes persulcatus]
MERALTRPAPWRPLPWQQAGLFLLVLAVLAGPGPGSTASLNFTWPVKRAVVVDGDVVLGALMMVHEREDRLTCGRIMPQGGIQALECMLFTLDWVNQQPDILPGFNLGAYVLDDCDKDTYGLEQAVDFIKGECRERVRDVRGSEVVQRSAGSAPALSTPPRTRFTADAASRPPAPHRSAASLVSPLPEAPGVPNSGGGAARRAKDRRPAGPGATE